MHYHLRRRILLVPTGKPSKSPALIPYFPTNSHPHSNPSPKKKKKKNQDCLAIVASLWEQIYFCRDGNCGSSQKRLTHSQWRCQFSGPRHCGRDNLIGEARRCVPARPHSKHCVTAARPTAGSSPTAAHPTFNSPTPPHLLAPTYFSWFSFRGAFVGLLAKASLRLHI